MKSNRDVRRQNQNIALEIKGYLSNLEFDFVDNDLLEDIKDFFKDKHAKSNVLDSESSIDSEEIDDEDDVSHEAQVAFLIEHGIEIKNNIQDLRSEYLINNFKRVEFYGVDYYLRIKDYGTEQKVYNFLIDNHIVSVAA
ncbi:hypothetical protein N1F78_12430 [Seonamhaeicola sp. MEBiC1930]|uniref:hypothetical protein n=1 Tax=Seonamhaeicola sp. MEBiC01930 TaxID=2976768 RepID=UPI00324BBA6C